MPGLPLREVVGLVTSRAAIIMGKADEIGSLRPGLAADVTVLRCTDRELALRDGDGAVCTMTRLLVLQLTVRASVVAHSGPAHGVAGVGLVESVSGSGDAGRPR
jgi:dihydroorotase